MYSFIKFSFLCEMDESSSRCRIPKTFDEEKVCVINSIPKSMAYENKWALQIFREQKVRSVVEISHDVNKC